MKFDYRQGLFGVILWSCEILDQRQFYRNLPIYQYFNQHSPVFFGNPYVRFFQRTSEITNGPRSDAFHPLLRIICLIDGGLIRTSGSLGQSSIIR